LVRFPERLDDWIGDDGNVRVVDFFIAGLELQDLASPARPLH
jgi:hypothetical protein